MKLTAAQKLARKNPDSFGSKILKIYDKYGNEKGPEAREITQEYGNKKFIPLIEKTIEEGRKKYRGTFYILVFGFADKYEPLASHVRILARQSRPQPEPKSLLYLYNIKSSELKIEWILPREEMMEDILKNPENFDKTLFTHVKAYKDGLLS